MGVTENYIDLRAELKIVEQERVLAELWKRQYVQ
jgi:hypothetical protein